MTEREFKHFFDQNFDQLRSYLFYRSGDTAIATDIAQETLIRIWEKQIKDEGKRTIRLAYKIAGDLFISQYRKEKTEANYLKSVEFELHDITPEDEMEYKELKIKFETAISELGEKQRVVFLMSRIDGLKYKEIADQLDISIKTVEKRMSIALNSMRLALKSLIILFCYLGLADVLYIILKD